jgi:hypothetical protein
MKSGKALYRAVRRHAMAGLAPAKSARITGSRRNALARKQVDESRQKLQGKVYQDGVAAGIKPRGDSPGSRFS